MIRPQPGGAQHEVSKILIIIVTKFHIDSKNYLGEKTSAP